MVEAMRKVEVLRAACCVAGVDGHTSDAEQAMLHKLASQIGVGYASLTAMIERAETEPTFYQEQFRVLKADPKETMQLLFRIAIVDEKLGRTEAVILKRLSQRLGVPDAKFDSWLRQAIRFLQKKSQNAPE